MLAPICLFTYSRLKETRKTIQALQENYLSSKSDLIIFSDGSLNSNDKTQVLKVRNYIHTIGGFNSVEVIESDHNKGLADSIISGVSKIISKYGKVIVLEDDLVTSANFLDFMNQALDYYQDSDQIFSISGYTMDLPSLEDYPKDYYLGYRASSWGWGTWKEEWEGVDWEVTDYTSFKLDIPRQMQFMRGGSDMPQMLWKQMNGKIDSWAIRWCYDQFKRNMFTVFPSTSKVLSIGFGEDATNTKNSNRFDTPLDSGEQRKFKFESAPKIDKVLVEEFRDKFSIKNRLSKKMKSLFK